MQWGEILCARYWEFKYIFRYENCNCNSHRKGVSRARIICYERDGKV